VVRGNGTGAFTAMTGITNYVTRWTSTTTLDIGKIYDNGTNVGIGTTTPAAALDVQATGVAGVNGSLAVFRDSGSAERIVVVDEDSSGLPCGFRTNTGFGMGFYTGAGAPFIFLSDSPATERCRITSDGKLGLGVSSPTETMEVNGTARFFGVMAASGATISTQRAINLDCTNLTGTTQYAATGSLTGTNAATAGIIGFYASPTTTNSIYTCTNVVNFWAANRAGGAGSTITNKVGFYCEDLTAGTNNFAFRSVVSSGTNKWNIYADGTANNVLRGNVRIGATTAPTNALDVTGTMTATVSVLAVGTGGVGYGTGSGGAVTQATSRTTGVTLNKTNGAITLVSAAGSTAWQSFTVTNSTVATTDTVIVNQKSGTDLYMIHVTNVAAGSFRITFATTGGTTTEQPVFNFAIIKAVTS
jgi:hypothetical protein